MADDEWLEEALRLANRKTPLSAAFMKAWSDGARTYTEEEWVMVRSGAAEVFAGEEVSSIIIAMGNNTLRQIEAVLFSETLAFHPTRTSHTQLVDGSRVEVKALWCVTHVPTGMSVAFVESAARAKWLCSKLETLGILPSRMAAAVRVHSQRAGIAPVIDALVRVAERTPQDGDAAIIREHFAK